MESEQQAFSQLLDRGLPSAVAQAVWCPTMDLLALLTSAGQLELHRLNWQRLWSVTPESPITCLCWRPDGKQLAIGRKDGRVALLNAEDGEVLDQSVVFKCPVVSLCWTNSSLKATPGHPMMAWEDRARKFFEPLAMPAMPGAPISAGFETFSERLGKREEASWPAKPDVLSIVACGSADGELAFCGEGLFVIGKIPLLTAGNTLHQISMPSSLSELAVLWQEANGASHLSLVDTSVLADSQHVLRMLCSYATDLLRSLHLCRKVSWQMWNEWQSVVTAMTGFKNTLNELLTQHAGDSNAQADLLLLVTMGEYTPAMEQFLMSSLGEPGLKKVARDVDAALSNMHALLADRLQPELELTCFRFGELRGLAASPMTCEIVGITSKAVETVEKDALQLLKTVEVLRDRLVFTAGQYRTFFAWLTTALRRFPEDTVDTMMGYPLSHVDSVRGFLHTEFASSTLEPYLSTAEDPKSFSPDRLSFELGVLESLDEPEMVISPASLTNQQQGFFEDLLRDIESVFKKEEDAANAGWNENMEYLSDAKKLRQGVPGLVEHLCTMHEATVRLLDRAPAALSKVLEKIDLGTGFGPINERFRHWNVVETCQQACAKAMPLGNEPASLAVTPAGVLSHSETGELKLVLPCDVTANGARLTSCVMQLSCSAVEREIAPLWASKNGLVKKSTPQEERAVSASVIAVPEGHSLVDFGCYKNGALAVLLQKDTTAGTENGAGAVLALIPEEVLQSATALTGALDAGAPVLEALAVRELVGLQLDLSNCRKRDILYRHVHRPLAVSATRGIGFALAGNQRGILYDLEEDEDVEGEGGEEEEAAAME